MPLSRKPPVAQAKKRSPKQIVVIVSVGTYVHRCIDEVQATDGL